MNLAEHWDKGEAWLGEGDHEVETMGFKTFTFNTGSPGLEVHLGNDDGKAPKLSFCLKDSILWMLAKFAKACGVSKEEAAKYDPSKEASHKMLMQRKVMVRILKNNKGYGEIVDYWPVGSDAPKQSVKESKAEEVAEEEVPF